MHPSTAHHTPSVARAVRTIATATAGLVAAVMFASPVQAQTGVGAPLGATCPALYVLGVQGPEEGAQDADADPIIETGALGQLFTPLHAHAGDLVQRAYLPYGRSSDGLAQPYDDAVADAANRVGEAAAEITRRCPATKLAVAGYGQGAAAAADFAHRTGTGTGTSTVDPSAVAGIALFANPNRAPGPVFPGRPEQASPLAAPGTSGSAVAGIRFTPGATAGSGIGQNTTATTDYGVLSGRVADFCTTGDLTCDAPAAGTPITQTVKNIAAQSDQRDPVAAITTTAQALAATAWKTAVGVAGEDLSGNSLDQLSYQPAIPLGQRLAEASNPATPMPGPDQALAALFRIGTIGLNTAVTIARKVFTPTTIAQLATVGMADPIGAIAILGTALAGAVAELVPPQTALSWVNQAFDAIRSTVSHDADLYQLATRTRYSDTDGRRASYTTATATPTGQPPLTAAADWFTALARDIDATHPATTAPKPMSPAATTPIATPSPSASPPPVPERPGPAASPAPTG
ncbi:cutinase family protein [Nocardia mexicana]|uniref:Cutinase n=1 Tax=Nocardia mexicana TaxID=279262 RepID=A0A370GIM8_9NOCA|nr:cutinase family protein [Nocardia mexicana]RDI43595.1 cutinase [Nocardia mexicana]